MMNRSSCPAGDASECHRQIDCEDCVKAREADAFWRIVRKKHPDYAAAWVIGLDAEDARQWAIADGHVDADEDVSIVRADMIGVLDTALECTGWGDDENLPDILEFVKAAIERLRDAVHKAEHDPVFEPRDLLNVVKQFLAGS